MMSLNKLFAVSTLSLALAACGGGGGGGGGSSSGGASTPVATNMLAGVAATGSPLANTTVTVWQEVTPGNFAQCSAPTTDINGNFQVNLSSCVSAGSGFIAMSAPDGHGNILMSVYNKIMSAGASPYVNPRPRESPRFSHGGGKREFDFDLDFVCIIQHVTI